MANGYSSSSSSSTCVVITWRSPAVRPDGSWAAPGAAWEISTTSVTTPASTRAVSPAITAVGRPRPHRGGAPGGRAAGAGYGTGYGVVRGYGLPDRAVRCGGTKGDGP